jgi:hypothetical protein
LNINSEKKVPDFICLIFFMAGVIAGVGATLAFVVDPYFIGIFFLGLISYAYLLNQERKKTPRVSEG